MPEDYIIKRKLYKAIILNYGSESFYSNLFISIKSVPKKFLKVIFLTRTY